MRLNCCTVYSWASLIWCWYIFGANHKPHIISVIRAAHVLDIKVQFLCIAVHYLALGTKCHLEEDCLSVKGRPPTYMYVLILAWPWPYLHDLDTRPWLRYSEYVYEEHTKMKFVGQSIQKLVPERDTQRSFSLLLYLDPTLIYEIDLAWCKPKMKFLGQG